MIKEMRKNEKGFTLVELVVVIAILAVLALLIVPRIMGNVEDSKRSKDIANARTIASEISTHNALVGTDSSGVKISGGPFSKENPGDLSEIKRTKDDLPSKEYAEIVVDSDGNAAVTVYPKK